MSLLKRSLVFATIQIIVEVLLTFLMFVLANWIAWCIPVFWTLSLVFFCAYLPSKTELVDAYLAGFAAVAFGVIVLYMLWDHCYGWWFDYGLL